MARILEVARARDLPAHVLIGAGDVLVFRAVGGLVRAGADLLDVLGPFRPGVMAPDGTVMSPEGPPNTVMFLARAPGSATIEVVSGDPWRGPERITLEIEIEA